MIRVNLSSLIYAQVGQRETVDLDLSDVSIGDFSLKYLKGELYFTRITEGILAESELRAAIKTTCTRCLTPFYETVLVELEDIIRLPGSDLTPEYPVRVDEEGWADVTPLVREYLWLSLPMNPVCSPDCKGICPECGGNLNRGECVCEDEVTIDPRWEALRTLVDQPEAGEGEATG